MSAKGEIWVGQSALRRRIGSRVSVAEAWREDLRRSSLSWPLYGEDTSRKRSRWEGTHHRVLHAEIGRGDMKITIRFIKTQFVFLSIKKHSE